MERLCLDIGRHVCLKGPTCMQLKRDDSDGLKFLEINPRMGGGSMFTTLAGVNIPMLLLDLIRGTELAPQAPKRSSYFVTTKRLSLTRASGDAAQSVSAHGDRERVRPARALRKVLVLAYRFPPQGG